jgi:predicted esterase
MTNQSLAQIVNESVQLFGSYNALCCAKKGRGIVSNQVAIQTYESFINTFMQRYGEKKYAEALAMLEQDGHFYPEQQPMIYYNRACMYGVQNLLPEALAVLREAADYGCWFSADMLHQDTDFTTLLGNPEFEALVQRFQQQRDAKQLNTQSTRIVTTPSADAAKPYPLLLTMHGNNNDAKSTAPRYDAAAKAGWLVGTLQSAQIGFTDNTFVWNDIEDSLANVEKHRAELTAEYPVDAQRIVVSGFSMGGQIASLLAVQQPFAIKGLIGIGTYLGDKQEEWAEQIATLAERGVRVYLLVGDKDDGCYPGTLRLAEMLRAANVPCELKVYPGMGHVYPPDFDEVLITALKFITA